MTAADGWVTGGRVELALRKTLLLQVVQPVSTPVPFCHHSCHHHCYPSFVILSTIIWCHHLQKIYVYVKGHICTYKWTFQDVTQSSACEICPVGNNPRKASSAFVLFCRDRPTLCFVLLSHGHQDDHRRESAAGKAPDCSNCEILAKVRR